MSIVALRLPPGLSRNGTRYQQKGRWYDANLVRFWNGTIQPVKGWVPLTTSSQSEAVAEDAFTSTANLDAHTPDTAITAWEYAGASTNWQTAGSYAYRDAFDEAAANVARSTNNITAPADITVLTVVLKSAASENSGVTGVLMFSNGSVTPPDLDGLGIFSWRSSTTVTELFIEVWESGVQSEAYALEYNDPDDAPNPSVPSDFSWALDTELTIVVTYDHPTINVVINGTEVMAPVTVTADLRGNKRLALVSENYGSESDKFLNVLLQNKTRVGDVELDGIPRAIQSWMVTGGQPYLGIGTTEKLYAYTQGILTDITPSGFTVGRENASIGVGGNTTYGSGFYGAGAYGVSSPLTGIVLRPDIWTLDTFGNYLVGVMSDSDGLLYVWDPATNDPAEEADNAPQNLLAVVTTPERFLVALGADGDPRLVQWASQETTDTWTPSANNSAGDYPLETTGQIVAGRKGRGETLIWTDVDVHAMTYIGGVLVYAFERRGFNCGLISPNAVARRESSFVWMGTRKFFLYDGYVKELPCDVADYVFGDFNWTQKRKVSCWPNVEWGEIWWHYCSGSSVEVDRYVAWNYSDNTWSFGQLARSCGIEMGADFPNPVLCAPTGEVYSHETGSERDGAVPYVESGPFELGDGERTTIARRMYPDENTLGDVQATLYARLYPTAAETTHGPYSLANPTSIRLMGRQMRLRLTQNRNVDWRVGTVRLDVVPGGTR